MGNRTRFAAGLALAAAHAALLAACGGDDGPTADGTPQACAITVNEPAAGDVVLTRLLDDANDDRLVVNWEAAGGGQVRVDLLQGGAPATVLAEATDNDGLLVARLGDRGLASAHDYTVAVTNLDDAGCGDTSAAFSVLDPDACSMDATSSRVGGPAAVVSPGDEMVVSWEAPLGSGRVDIELWHRYGYGDNGLVGLVAEAYAGDSPLTWTVTSMGWTVAGDYFLRVVDARFPDCGDPCAAFEMHP